MKLGGGVKCGKKRNGTPCHTMPHVRMVPLWQAKCPPDVCTEHGIRPLFKYLFKSTAYIGQSSRRFENNGDLINDSLLLTFREFARVSFQAHLHAISFDVLLS